VERLEAPFRDPALRSRRTGIASRPAVTSAADSIIARPNAGRRPSTLKRVGKVWILHTDTKGTGANMVPLENITKRSSDAEPVSVPRKPKPPEQAPPKPKAPRRFRVVDVMTGQPLLDSGSGRDAAAALRDVRSVVDVNVYVWQDERERWRLLTLPEQRAMWELASERADAASTPERRVETATAQERGVETATAQERRVETATA
jgi:hypothetical protein